MKQIPCPYNIFESVKFVVPRTACAIYSNFLFQISNLPTTVKPLQRAAGACEVEWKVGRLTSHSLFLVVQDHDILDYFANSIR